MEFKFTHPLNMKMPKEPINPVGSCYQSAYNDLMSNPDMPVGTILCHGVGVSNSGPDEGKPMAHAWLEWEGYAFDTTWGIRRDKMAYRSALKLDYVLTYTKEDAKALYENFKHRGPYDKKIQDVADKWNADNKK